MENKQTAVDWLVSQVKLGDKSFDEFFRGEIQQAKAMEKEQIEVAFNESRKIQDSDEISITYDWNNSEQYYNETYGKQDNS